MEHPKTSIAGNTFYYQYEIITKLNNEFPFYSLIILLFLISCRSKPIVYKIEDYSGQHFSYMINKKKTGTFYYPKMNFKYTLHKGKLNREILLIKKMTQ